MTRLDIPGNAALCGIIGHQEAGSNSDQDFIYLPWKYLPERGGQDGDAAADPGAEPGGNRDCGFRGDLPGGDRE